MAMIECPECGKRISDKAPACPGCGILQSDIQKMLSAGKTVQEQKDNAESFEDLMIKRFSKVSIANVRCIMCGNVFSAVEHMACPTCGQPVLALGKYEMQDDLDFDENNGGAEDTAIQTLDLKEGQFFKMGHYGGEEINWRVLAVENGKALLISEKGLDAKKYNERKENVTWETCTLRKWLNSDFYNSAFEVGEREKIVMTKVTADKNPAYNTDPGKDTEDKIFLLSIKEAEEYFTDGEDRKAYATEYAKANGAYVDEDVDADLDEDMYEDSSTKCCWWWLRSPGFSGHGAADVLIGGWVYHFGHDVLDVRVCVRPALWVNL